MKKPPGTKVATKTTSSRKAPPWAPEKSRRRILRAISQWADVSRIVAAGGKPDLDDIAFLLRLGEPVPPDVQNYLADLLDGSLSRSKGRPKKHPGQLYSERLQAAKALFEAVNGIREKVDISVAKA